MYVCMCVCVISLYIVPSLIPIYTTAKFQAARQRQEHNLTVKLHFDSNTGAWWRNYVW